MEGDGAVRRSRSPLRRRRIPQGGVGVDPFDFICVNTPPPVYNRSTPDDGTAVPGGWPEYDSTQYDYRSPGPRTQFDEELVQAIVSPSPRGPLRPLPRQPPRPPPRPPPKAPPRQWGYDHKAGPSSQSEGLTLILNLS